jgi:hypothetical protein
LWCLWLRLHSYSIASNAKKLNGEREEEAVSKACCGISAIELTKELVAKGNLSKDIVKEELCSALYARYASCAFVNKGGHKAKGLELLVAAKLVA